MSSKPAIILIEPQLGENIGFIARVMGNFGFSDLRIVNPRDGWPNEAARSTATKASHIIDKAQIFDSFPEAVKDLQLLYASTARTRDCNKECIAPNELHEEISHLKVQPQKIGVLFGPERSGLDNKIISKCDKIIQIPTTKEVPSLNIAISAGVICYELSSLKLPQTSVEGVSTQEEKDFLMNFLEQSLRKSGFNKSEQKHEKIMQNLSNVINRIPNFTSNEVSTLVGVIKSLLEYSK